MTFPLEVAVFSHQDALIAQTHGAQRIEINAPGSYPDGGLTPPRAILQLLSPQLNIPMRVMIRPRGPPADGSMDFQYTKAELEEMLQAILEIKGADDVMRIDRGDGFVFGILQAEEPSSNGTPLDMPFTIDEQACKRLIEAASPIPCVFHRAFDPIASSIAWQTGLDTLIRCGFQGLLTAGGAHGSCLENLPRLKTICSYASGKIQVVAGGGVRHHNVANALSVLASSDITNKFWIHSAALKSNGEGIDEDELKKLLSRLHGTTTTS